ncbi:hypothetical protein EII17_07530 [Clostridiales bacterium COT073_COT-073]|nr:hypothetical protein EII17_07530 [Clostridiales bacterium COT073_COT-073]
MRIALINEDSQAGKNTLIYGILASEAKSKGHEVDNYGMFSEEDKHEINFTQIGVIASVLLESQAADFIVTGCGTGQGAMISCNAFSNLVCGYVNTPLDAYLFSQVNAGNAISIPFAQNFGWGAEINLRHIFRTLFEQPFGGGYPNEYAEAERKSRIKMMEWTKKPAQYPVEEAIQRMDQERLYHLLNYKEFKNLFYKNAKSGKIEKYIKELLEK